MNALFRAFTWSVFLATALAHAAPSTPAPSAPRGRAVAAPEAKVVLPSRPTPPASPTPSPEIIASDYTTPSGPETVRQRDEAWFQCLEDNRFYTRPRRASCDGGTEVDPDRFLVDVANSMASFGTPIPPLKECNSLTYTGSRDGASADRLHCPRDVLEKVTEGERVAQSMLRCLATEHGNPQIAQKIRRALAQRASPLWSCVSPDSLSGASEERWREKCRARVVPGAAPGALERCVEVFKKTRRVVFFHPVFPERAFVRTNQEQSLLLGSEEVIGRVLFREWMRMAGYDPDGIITDGCSGLCGPLPGVMRVWTERGCYACRKDTVTEDPTSVEAVRCRSEAPAFEDMSAISALRNFEECRAGILNGDTAGLLRACQRLASAKRYREVCGEKAPSRCLEQFTPSRELEQRLEHDALKAQQRLSRLPEWERRKNIRW